jgi:hypothetical protein
MDNIKEKNMARKIEEIQQEYNSQAAIVGDLVYRIRIMNLDLGRMMKKLKELQKEAARVAGKQAPQEEVVNEPIES